MDQFSADVGGKFYASNRPDGSTAPAVWVDTYKSFSVRGDG